MVWLDDREIRSERSYRITLIFLHLFCGIGGSLVWLYQLIVYHYSPFFWVGPFCYLFSNSLSIVEKLIWISRRPAPTDDSF